MFEDILAKLLPLIAPDRAKLEVSAIILSNPLRSAYCKLDIVDGILKVGINETPCSDADAAAEEIFSTMGSRTLY